MFFVVSAKPIRPAAGCGFRLTDCTDGLICRAGFVESDLKVWPWQPVQMIQNVQQLSSASEDESSAEFQPNA